MQVWWHFILDTHDTGLDIPFAGALIAATHSTRWCPHLLCWHLVEKKVLTVLTFGVTWPVFECHQTEDFLQEPLGFRWGTFWHLKSPRSSLSGVCYSFWWLDRKLALSRCQDDLFTEFYRFTLLTCKKTFSSWTRFFLRFWCWACWKAGFVGFHSLWFIYVFTCLCRQTNAKKWSKTQCYNCLPSIYIHLFFMSGIVIRPGIERYRWWLLKYEKPPNRILIG